ncbi:MarR family winged helix-turn-helix transcriptional regulator [Tardiphaga sp.]|uniref:MarR family winged helix-turn-helix transcriptional regulator n=1 Tax=Tardiphaga sp. TaxID=1926292 RepID=UPI00352AC5C1
MAHSPTLGTLLRRLIDVLDGAVEESYADAGLDYRPRYTPIMRELLAQGPATIRALAKRSGVTHSATGQTVNQMAKHGLVTLTTGDDARERIVALTPHAEKLVPQLQQLWAATEAAARTLDDSLGLSLPEVIARTLKLLEEVPFSERLREASNPVFPQ